MAAPITEEFLPKMDRVAGRTGALLVLQEDPKLLMWFDQALTRSGEET